MLFRIKVTKLKNWKGLGYDSSTIFSYDEVEELRIKLGYCCIDELLVDLEVI